MINLIPIISSKTVEGSVVLGNKIIQATPEQWTARGTIILAIVTFFAVIVALFQEKIKDFFLKAKLEMKIILSPPDTHQIALTDQSGRLISKCIYIRIRVTHLKGKSAEDVEIMVSNFWQIINGKKIRVKEFLPMNLKWSHFQSFTIPAINIRIPRGLFRHCDFGRIQPKASIPVLILDTMVQPNPVADDLIPNQFFPGKYEFELLLSGSNTKLIKKRWIIEFDNYWSDDEREMLKHIHIQEVK
jgi:hypothetical protein